jgi:C4-dicarboxylate-specific signal transduction histidine kinase
LTWNPFIVTGFAVAEAFRPSTEAWRKADVISLLSGRMSFGQRRGGEPEAVAGAEIEPDLAGLLSIEGPASIEGPVSINDVVRRTMDLTLSSVPAGRVITLGVLPPGFPHLAVPKQLAVQVLASVLRNAVNSAHREVSLAVRRDRRVAVIEVRDDGLGFHPADVNEIFIPGVRAVADLHAPIRVDRHLSVAHRLARSVGGGMSVVPDPAAGRVEIRLPLAV